MEGILGRIVAIVLGLLALAGIGIAGYQAFGNNKAAQISNDMTASITNARAQFSTSSNGFGNFTTANTAALFTAGVFPANMNRGGVLTDAWGNPVTVAPTALNTQATIKFGGGGSETQSQCVAVATGLKDYVSLTVGGTTFTQANLPDAVSAAGACATAATAITITFQ